jgi:hypothetical protein
MLGVFGALAGILGALAGLAAVFWGLGVREYLGGKKPRYSAAVNREELLRRLLAINGEGLSFEVRPGRESDLEVEWKIADARWFAFFARERLRETYRAFLVLDPARTSVRYCEEMVRVEWVAGSDGLFHPTLSYQSEFFRGRVLFQKSWGAQYGVRDDLSLGKVYQYSFDVRTVRDPIRKVVEESGWEFVPVVRKSHATFKSLPVAASSQ